MGIRENNIVKKAMIAVSKMGTRVFRQNTGEGWIGDWRYVDRESRTVVIKNARRIRMGLIKGSSDLIGWHPVIVTQEMVGKKIAVFVAMEGKTADGKATDEQENFIKVISDAGGAAGIFTSDAEAVDIISRLG